MIIHEKLDLTEINRRVLEDPEGLVRECEADYAAQISRAADAVVANLHRSPVVLLSGPSGSGKTTTAFRLEHELEARGITTHSVSLDDYFHTVDPHTAPRTPEGDIDYESPRCLDIELLSEHFDMLARGEEIKIPRYMFARQKRSASTFKALRLGENEAAIFEGIHALNDNLTAPHPEAVKLYVSASSSFWINKKQVFDRTWLRLMRRVVRDNNFRGADAAYTLEMWPNVLRGERLYIDPYKGSADIWINSALAYEVAVTRRYAEPLFAQLTKELENCCELQKIRPALELFEEMDPSLIPPESLLREFIGGSRYNYG